MLVAVTVGVYNEEKHLRPLLDALVQQTRPPDEIILVDDGSTDNTGAIIRGFAQDRPLVRYFRQENAGPAAARNRAWRNSRGDICVFTDGDCLPEPNWLEEILKPFADGNIGAVAGTYKTLNTDSTLARCIGLEIAWRYREVQGEIDVHGTYNLAVRKKILEEVGGFNEEYREPSAEDWDLTYKISKNHPIIYWPAAVVGHHHPEGFWRYLKNQVRRAYDRVKLYQDHRDKRQGDTYTPGIIKYQILAAGALAPSLILFLPLFPSSFLVPLALVAFLLYTSLLPFPYLFRRDPRAALLSIPVRFCRNFAWLLGLAQGILRFGIG